MRIVLIIIAACMLITQSFGQDRFVITESLPEKIGSAIDWKAIESSKPEPRKLTVVVYEGCVPCKQLVADLSANPDVVVTTIDRKDIPSGYPADAFPLTILSDTETPTTKAKYFKGYQSPERFKETLKRNPPTGVQSFFGPVSVGKISRKVLGLTQTNNAASISLGGFSATFPSATPEVTLNPPLKVGNGTIEISVTKARLSRNQVILTAQGWPVEFSLELTP